MRHRAVFSGGKHITNTEALIISYMKWPWLDVILPDAISGSSFRCHGKMSVEPFEGNEGPAAFIFQSQPFNSFNFLLRKSNCRKYELPLLTRWDHSAPNEPAALKTGPCTWHIIALSMFRRQEEKLLAFTMEREKQKGEINEQ